MTAAALVDFSWSQVIAIFMTIVSGRLWFEVGRVRLNAWIATCPEEAADLLADLHAGVWRAYRHALLAVIGWPILLPEVRPAKPKDR